MVPCVATMLLSTTSAFRRRVRSAQTDVGSKDAEMKSVPTSVGQARSRRSHTKTKTGCDTCKRRRVKCDETRPFCLKCVSTGRTCYGYHPPRPWIFDPESSLSNETRDIGPLPSSHSSRQRVESRSSNDAAHSIAAEVTQRGTAPNSIFLDWSAAYKEPLIASFLSKFLSNRSNNPSCLSFTAWPHIACKLAGVPRHEFLTTALMSCSLCILSFEEQDPRLWAGAISIYQQSLPRLRRAISRLSQWHSDSLRKAVIAACFVLAVEESMMSSCLNADQHIEGIATIIQHGGPDVLEEDGVRRLFYDHLPYWLCICSIRQQLPVFAQAEWLEAQQKFQTTLSQTSFQRFWNTITKALPTMVEYDNSKQDMEEIELWRLITKVNDHLASLQEWREQDEDLTAISAPEALSTTDEQRHRWRQGLEGRGLETTTNLLYYLAFEIQLNLIKLDIAKRLSQRDVKVISIIGEVKILLQGHVRTITETLPFNLRLEYGLEGVVHMSFPLHACWKGYQALENPSSETLFVLHDLGRKLREKGFQPVKEPWLELYNGNSPTTFTASEDSPSEESTQSGASMYDTTMMEQ